MFCGSGPRKGKKTKKKKKINKNSTAKKDISTQSVIYKDMFKKIDSMKSREFLYRLLEFLDLETVVD